MPKQHWCGRCRKFVDELIEARGYYKRMTIVCPRCGSSLGTPEEEK